MTSQRISMGVHFMSPPFASDHLYLIAPRGQPQEDFVSMLAKPFSPFQPELWALIIVYIVLSALVTAVTDLDNATSLVTEVS